MRTISDSDYMDWMYETGYSDDAVEDFGCCLDGFREQNPFDSPEVRSQMLAVVREVLEGHAVPQNMIPIDFVSFKDDEGYTWRLPDVE